MKNINHIQKTRLQLLAFSLIIAIFIGVLIWIFSPSSNEKMGNGTNSGKVVNPYAEPRLLADAEKISFLKSLDWSNTVYNFVPNLRVAEYPKSGIVIDLNTNKVLWAKNPHQKVAIASMSKLMTVLLALEALEKEGSLITLDSKVVASRKCANIRVGAMGLVPNQEYFLRELLQAAVIRSANDCAAQAGEFIGSQAQEDFIVMMNRRSKELNMINTHFVNAHGLPEGKVDNISTALDVAIMSNEVLRHPQYLEWAKIYQTFAVNNTKELTNTNNLVRRRKTPGVDGLKTGFTNRAGSCLAFSCFRDGKRVIGVITGFNSSKSRDNFAELILDWAYKQK